MSEFYAKSSNKSWSPGKRFHILYLRPLGDKLCETVTSGWRPYFTISRAAQGAGEQHRSTRPKAFRRADFASR